MLFQRPHPTVTRVFVWLHEEGSPNCGDSVGGAPNNRDLDPIGETGAGAGTTPDCPSAEGSENMSVTNSEVESSMNHQRCRAVLRDPEFSEEAFNAFSSADAYIRTARNGLSRATKQYLTDV